MILRPGREGHAAAPPQRTAGGAGAGAAGALLAERFDAAAPDLGAVLLSAGTGAGAGARNSVGTGVMGGMLAATFLAIFFVPFFFKLIMERKFGEPRTADEIKAEVAHHHKTMVSGAPHTPTRPTPRTEGMT